jgi:hypothetical protein
MFCSGALRQAGKPDLPDLAFFLSVLCPMMSNRVGGQGATNAGGAETRRLGQNGYKMSATSSPMDSDSTPSSIKPKI